MRLLFSLEFVTITNILNVFLYLSKGLYGKTCMMNGTSSSNSSSMGADPSSAKHGKQLGNGPGSVVVENHSPSSLVTVQVDPHPQPASSQQGNSISNGHHHHHFQAAGNNSAGNANNNGSGGGNSNHHAQQQQPSPSAKHHYQGAMQQNSSFSAQPCLSHYQTQVSLEDQGIDMTQVCIVVS